MRLPGGLQAVVDPLVHFGSRFPGEGEGKNLVNLDLLFCQQPVESFCQDAGLARPGACHNNGIAVNGNGLLLGRIKIQLHPLTPHNILASAYAVEGTVGAAVLFLLDRYHIAAAADTAVHFPDPV
ncbi:hypothetical protein ES703_63396 [subsurface metagenome]